MLLFIAWVALLIVSAGMVGFCIWLFLDIWFERLFSTREKIPFLVGTAALCLAGLGMTIRNGLAVWYVWQRMGG